MIECPECGAGFRGPKCGCGYTPKSFPIVNHEFFARTQADERRHYAETRKWLREHGIEKEGMTITERMKACADFRKKILREKKEPSLDWARELYSRHLDGEILTTMQLSLAKAALGVEWK